MNGFPAKQFFTTTLLAGSLLVCPFYAQAQTDNPPRAASFLPAGTIPAQASYSGLATALPEAITPPPVISVPALAPPASMPPIQTPPAPSPPTLSAAPPPVVPSPVMPTPSDAPPKPVATILPAISPETVSVKNVENLGAEMWKFTPRSIADILLTNAVPTQSSLLNTLMRRLLTTAATPPEGDSTTLQSLTATRITKLISFGDSTDAWTLAQNADAKLVDDTTFHLAAENALANDDSLCTTADSFTKTRSTVDWQKLLITCQLRAKDSKTAQVALDVMRNQSVRDSVFIDIADKDILTDSKKLPSQLTPLTPPALALLHIANLPLPADLYTHPDSALIPALLRLPAQQEVAKLALAEKAASRGLITDIELATLYRGIAFTPDALANAASSTETGLRLHALLFHAAENEQDPVKRINYAIKFLQSASPVFLNNTAPIVATILGTVKPDPAQSSNAPDIAMIYMMANRPEALDWYKLAQSDPKNADKLLALYPQFALAGLAAEADFDKWLTSATKTDTHDARDAVASTLLLLDAAGVKIPETVWAKAMETPIMEKKISLSPVLLDRLQNAGANGRRAETILLAINVAGGDTISVPKVVGITRALRFAGFKTEATIFARQSIALLGVKN